MQKVKGDDLAGMGGHADNALPVLDQVKKNLDTQARQPASMRDVGMDSDKAGVKGDIDVSKLSADEFAALPESTKAKLRGDLL
jgi:hypothetical protein